MDASVSHRELAAWNAAIALAGRVYGATAHLPSEDPYGLAQQLRRAAAAIPTRIAEGAARCNRNEFIHALRLARGSLAELETHLMIAGRQALVSDSEPLLHEVAQIGRLIAGLLRKVTERRVPESHFQHVAAGLTADRLPRGT